LEILFQYSLYDRTGIESFSIRQAATACRAEMEPDARRGEIRPSNLPGVKLPPIAVAADQKPTADSLSQSYT
jgi:hypothetical protein